jgi:opacity protein-like surface antigen
MKKILLASACVFALSGAAFAQSQPAPGASSEGNVGPGAGTATPHAKGMKSGTTTGTGSAAKTPGMSNPSSEGNVGPGTNNNSGKQPGGR